jgi:hypothetical protein
MQPQLQPVGSAAADRQRWNALWAATSGYMLDAMDVLLYFSRSRPFEPSSGYRMHKQGL